MIGNWHHIILTRSSTSGQLSVYVDGSLQTSVTGEIGDVVRSFSSIGRIEDTAGSPEYFAGQLDELLIFDSIISSTDVQIIYENQLQGRSWDGALRTCATPLAEWRFEENSWNGTADEVIDSGGNHYHGQLYANNASPQNVSPAISGDSGTCNYASFSGGWIVPNSLPLNMNNGAKTTVTFWMRWDGTNNVAPLGWGTSFDLWINNGNFGFTTSVGGLYGVSASTISGGWHHIAAEFTNGYGLDAVSFNRLWIDGVEQVLSELQYVPRDTVYRSVNSTFYIGSAGGALNYNGDMDEVGVYNGSLSASQIITLMNNTHPCSSPAPSYFAISHDNNAVYCLNESMSVTARDSDDTTFSTYTGTITLDTQAGKGSWSLLTGSGTLLDSVANDGLATYTFVASDNGSASFSLNYSEGAAIVDVDVYDNATRDDDSEGQLSFAASGFSVTASPLSNPPVTPINQPIGTQLSGQAFTVAMAAYGTDPDNGNCGIIETYTGNKSIVLDTHYNNPTTGTLSATGGGTIPFIAGQASFLAQYNDVGQIALTVTDSATSMTGQTNLFIVQPNDFSITVVGNIGTTDAGSGFMASGQAFTVDVQALNALNNPAPNYGNEIIPESVTLSIDSLVFPAGGNIGTLDNADSFTKISSNTLQNTAVSWSEVGSIRLQASVADADYLGTGNITGTVSGTIGRFYPDSFVLGSQQVMDACVNFTYLSEPNLSIAYTLSAVNQGGNTVTNYDVGLGYPVATQQYHAELDNDGNDLGVRLSLATSNWSAGEYILLDNHASFSRDSSLEAPLSSLLLGLSVQDIDNRNLSSLTMNADSNDDCSLAETCTAGELGRASFYYGRLTLPSTYGPETAELPAELQTEYWDGQQFVLNSHDNCSLIPRAAITVNGAVMNIPAALTVDLQGGSTTAQFFVLTNDDVGFVGGNAGLRFSAPGTAITTKSFDVDIDLTNRDWLTFDWDQDGNVINDTAIPTATMSFKMYRGHDRVLYWRHKY
ncbi:hypothetical protein AB835_10145 [Candidatus Endobugula sertula]|uniref:DUF6701 domain-containing protein n=1 Tax=Candidatus Endobugula sertula TaxID=62101 RepID=A0A1D2QNS0_9GAMM|nr:hypothetical protein AB835_10145 [Candidatus Endobugula sertula]